MNTLEAGFVKTDITPETNRQTIYHRSGQLDDDKTPVRDRLFARATAFRSASEVGVWVTADLLCVDTRLRDAVTARLAKEGIPPDHVALCATHTHTAPTIVPFHSVEPTPEDYLVFLESKLAEVVLEAVRSARPAQIAFGKTTVDLSVNRREIGRMSEINDMNAPTGLVDKTVRVARISMLEGGGQAVLLNYAAHPISMSKNCPLISADYPGKAVEFLESRGFAFAQFLQGCAGNANMKIHGDEREAGAIGRGLGQAVIEAVEWARPSSSCELRMVTERVRLPWGKMATEAEARSFPRKDRRAQDWAEAVLRAYTQNQVRPYSEVLIQAMRLGDAVFVALPGEVFLEIGLAIRRAAGIENLFVVAYSNNDEIGYIPTRAAFLEGGYEVDSAPYYYGLFQLSPDCESITVDAAVRAARSVS